MTYPDKKGAYLAFDAMVRRWFVPARVPCNRFVRALLSGDLDAMNAYLAEVALDTFGTANCIYEG